jgi:hypothetical protein
MIVESKALFNNVESTDYITCSKCGGESKRIGTKYGAFSEEFKDRNSIAAEI